MDVDADVDVSSEGPSALRTAAAVAGTMLCTINVLPAIRRLLDYTGISGRNTLLTYHKDVPSDCAAESCASRDVSSDEITEKEGFEPTFWERIEEGISEAGAAVTGALMALGSIIGAGGSKAVEGVSIEGKDVSRAFEGVGLGEKVLFVDFIPENVPEARGQDSVLADHHAVGMEGKTATAEVWRLRNEGALKGVVRVVGNHMDTDRVMAEAIGRGIITDPAMAERAIAAAHAGDHLIGESEAMRANWIIMAMIHGDRGGEFEKVPTEEILRKVPEVLSNPERFEMYYRGTEKFMEASRAAFRKGKLEIRGRVAFVETESYVHPLVVFSELKDRGVEVVVKRTYHEKGGWQYDISIVPEVATKATHDLSRVFESLKTAEAQANRSTFSEKDNWGCDPKRAGGSPRGYGSKMDKNRVLAIVESDLVVKEAAPKAAPKPKGVGLYRMHGEPAWERPDWNPYEFDPSEPLRQLQMEQMYRTNEAFIREHLSGFDSLSKEQKKVISMNFAHDIQKATGKLHVSDGLKDGMTFHRRLMGIEVLAGVIEIEIEKRPHESLLDLEIVTPMDAIADRAAAARVRSIKGTVGARSRVRAMSESVEDRARERIAKARERISVARERMKGRSKLK